MKKTLWTFLFLILTSPVFAAIETQLSYFAWGNKTEGAQLGNGEGYLSDLQVKLGYAGSEYFVGAIYDQYTNELGNSRPRTSYGISLGYRPQNWFFDFNYFIVSTYQLSSTVKLTNGSGYSFDLGYRWSLGSTFFAGLQFSWRSLSYPDVEISGTITSSNNKVTSEYMPAFVLGLRF
jgi:hypothetical protein